MKPKRYNRFSSYFKMWMSNPYKQLQLVAGYR